MRLSLGEGHRIVSSMQSEGMRGVGVRMEEEEEVGRGVEEVVVGRGDVSSVYLGSTFLSFSPAGVNFSATLIASAATRIITNTSK